MFSKVAVIICVVFVFVDATPIAPGYAGYYQPQAHSYEEADAYPKYDFAYDIKDEYTGDVKSQKEERDGDNVKGYYSLIEADGSKRIVEYTADEHNGFNAIVHKEEGYAAAPAYKSAPAPLYKAAAPIVAYPAPTYYKSAYPAPTLYKSAYPAPAYH